MRVSKRYLGRHQIDELVPLVPEGGIVVRAEMSDVHLIGNLAHFLNKAAKRLALHLLRHGVHDGAKLGTIAVCNTGEQLSALSFLESIVSSLKDDGRIGCCQVP